MWYNIVIYVNVFRRKIDKHNLESEIMDNDIELGDTKPKDNDNKQHKIQASFNTVDPNQSELHSNLLYNKRKDTNNTSNGII